MPKTYYEVLGVSTRSSASEIRSAYRRLVLLHHPDRSNDPASKTIFLAVTEAYQVLGDASRRQRYDAGLAAPRPRPAPPAPRSQSARAAEIKLDVGRLSIMVSRGHYSEAEALARNILERDSRQSVAYLILGDLARIRGDKSTAIRMYASATHYDPLNPVPRQRYEALTDRPIEAMRRTAVEPARRAPSGALALPFGIGVVLLAASYVGFAREAAFGVSLSLVSTWTLGLVVMLFFSGVAMGATLSLDRLVGSFRTVGQSSFTPTVALAAIAVVNFWVAVALYAVIGGIARSSSASTSRLLSAVAVGTGVIALGAEASSRISGFQVILWGGNLVYLGALSGWMATDALRSAGE